ncbi:hypothetical protein K449DRAFT_444677 [Hypoxylon sp. EC38]|nr:hypothetical protein K449DRAFT_444677 [Hypoxylon sp. EC38]
MSCPEKSTTPPPKEVRPLHGPAAKAAGYFGNQTRVAEDLPKPVVDDTAAIIERRPARARRVRMESPPSPEDKSVPTPDCIQGEGDRPAATGEGQPTRSSSPLPRVFSCIPAPVTWSFLGAKPTGVKKSSYEQPQGLSAGAFSAKHVSFEIGSIGTINYNGSEYNSRRKRSYDDDEPSREILSHPGLPRIIPTWSAAWSDAEPEDGPAFATNAERNAKTEEAQEPSSAENGKK